jgi:putative chitinase
MDQDDLIPPHALLEVAAELVRHMAALKFDQLIAEGRWVHVSFSPRPRNQVLTAHFSASGVSYTQGLS